MHAPLPARGAARVTRRVVEVVDKGRAALVVCEDRVGDVRDGRGARGGSRARAARRIGAGAPASTFTPPALAGRRAGVVGVLDHDARSRPRCTAWPATATRCTSTRRSRRRPGSRARSCTGCARSGPWGWRWTARPAPERRLASLAGRFVRPVFPGDTLELEAWSGLSVARRVGRRRAGVGAGGGSRGCVPEPEWRPVRALAGAARRGLSASRA